MFWVLQLKSFLLCMHLCCNCVRLICCEMAPSKPAAFFIDFWSSFPHLAKKVPRACWLLASLSQGFEAQQTVLSEKQRDLIWQIEGVSESGNIFACCLLIVCTLYKVSHYCLCNRYDSFYINAKKSIMELEHFTFIDSKQTMWVRWKSTCSYITLNTIIWLYMWHTRDVLEKIYWMHFSSPSELNPFIPLLTENMAMRRKIMTSSTAINIFKTVIRILYEIL